MSEKLFVNEGEFDFAAFYEDSLAHVGTDHLHPGKYTGTGSGRHPFGSGDNPHQHDLDLYYELTKLRNSGYSDDDIAKVWNMNTNEFRKQRTLSTSAYKMYRYEEAKILFEKGSSNIDIANKLNCTEGTVRNMRKQYDAGVEVKETKLGATKTLLKGELAKYENKEPVSIIDVGDGSERYIGVSQVMKDNALEALKREGYVLHTIQVAQVNNFKNKTTVKILAKVNADWDSLDTKYTTGLNPDNEDEMKRMVARYAYAHLDEIHPISDTLVIKDDSAVVKTIKPPVSVDSNRIKVAYADDPVDGETNLAREGTMVLRPSAADLTMTNYDANNITHYAQVRIGVDGTHYLKGMAMLGNESDFPDGVDIIFYTKKSSSVPKMDVFKRMKTIYDDDGNKIIDPENPFGAAIKANGQRTYLDADGNERQSCVNILKEEGDWNEYSKSLAAQFLSKQSLPLIKDRLNASMDDVKDQLDQISKIENPAVRKKFLEEFADNCDTHAHELDAAAVSGQLTQVLLPIPSVPSGQIYAPNFKDGDKVALIRYPHAGIFEIPYLTVNNKIPGAVAALGKCKDAVGVNKETLDQLSGADTDGDTAVIIPESSLAPGTRVDHMPYLEGLVGYDPQEDVPYVEGVTRKNPEWDGIGKEGKTMTKRERGQQMGYTTNLIMDMTAQGCEVDDLTRAVKHSMVVVDAYKHGLDWRASEEKYGITELKMKYQGSRRGGGSTIFTRAGGGARVNDFKLGQYQIDENGKKHLVTIDSKTGEPLYRDTGETYIDKKGVERNSTTEITKMAKAWREGKDAFSLVSEWRTDKEVAYAEYSNAMHQLANNTRLIVNNMEGQAQNKEARQQYQAEIASINEKLITAQMNAPRERLAQMQATSVINAKLRANPAIREDEEELKKLKKFQLNQARARTGASGKETRIHLTAKEYEAINAGAIGSTTLDKVLAKCDSETLRELAMPKTEATTLNDAQIARLKMAYNGGQNVTQAQLAEQFGISVSTVNRLLKEG